jgi:signal transduction histidine kinase/DNA-binding response OmpR family regulator/putative methionine-R-sulfoxide reductase with GAF domain
MLKQVLAAFQVPESELPRVQSLLTIILRGATVVVVFLVITSLGFIMLTGQTNWFWLVGVVLAAILFGLTRLNQRGEVSLSVNLLLATITIYAASAEPLGFPEPRLHMLIYAVPIAIAALLLPTTAVLYWGVIVESVILLRAFVLSMVLGMSFDNFMVFLVSLPGLAIVTGIMWLFNRSFYGIQTDLLRQVQQGRAGIEIGHTVSSAIDPPSVIHQAVQLIYDAFGYYHVGLFTVDSDLGIAVLADAAGAAASELKERGFSTTLSGTTAVAAAINHKRQWIVVSWEERVDPNGRPVRFTYDRLPTRAELVLPLLWGDRILGALDIHSTEMDPFSEADVHTLEGLVGNVANALEGARLLDDVQQRHQELETIYAQTERRARYLEATAELARTTSSLLDQQELLERAVELISQSLSLYHAGVFLIDETGEWAVLMAASSEGGRHMLARGHKLGVGQQGIVGWVTGTGEARIALDVGEDAVYFDNPDMPETRSEIALPLKVGDRMLGALDVQSNHEAAFSDEDAVILQALADQVAIAIQNARLFQETQRALEEVQALQRYYVAQEWERLSQRGSDVSAEYRSLGVSTLEEVWSPEMEIALSQEQPVALPDLSAIMEDDGGDGRGEREVRSALPALSALAVPITLQGEVIGVLDLQETDQHREWTREEVEIVTSVADQLALALENARLVEETQRRARQLAAASAVARDATAILEGEQLLNETVELISERFGFYHAGAFLVDEQNEYAVMRAASSEGGRKMLARGHRLKIGEVGIVGYVAATGEPRVASDVDLDAVWYNAPELPETRSEMALALKARERVIGVLDVQSTDPAAFSEDDVAVLQTLADQLATAIANADLFQRVREDANRRALINEVSQAAASSLDVKELLGRSGEAISRQLEMPCTIFDWDEEAGVLMPVTVHDSTGADVTPPKPEQITPEMAPAMFQAVRTRQLQVLFDVTANVGGVAADLARRLDLQDAAYTPLTSRDQILGLLELGRQKGYSVLDEGALSFLEVVATNLGVAVENAQLYQDAVETAERLEEVDRLKTQFLANMSHELRTPLNSIIGFSRVILKEIDGPLTDMQRTDLQTVYESGQHLLSLINNILDIVKIEAGKMEISIEEVDLKPIITSVMSTAVALIRDKDIELQTSLPDDLPIIQSDSRRVRQVLLNLVGNSAKFTEEGFIRVEAKLDGEEVTISVVDSGIGIPEDKLAMIFEAFTQVDASSTRRAGGTGLGLSICQSFVEMHGGRIWVESEFGKGSTFAFALPIEGPPPPEAEGVEEQEAKPEVVEPPDSVEEEPVEEVSKLVLCVEDDEGVITLFRRYLSKRGYQVVGLTDPTRALEEAKRLKPHAITLDVMMPDKNGWQVIQELKADSETRHIPVIICSIVAERDRGMSLGASDYLVKPIVEQDLLAALDRLDREAGRHLVLVVDDQPEHRQLLRRMIENQDGYEVVEAGGGKEAIDMLKQIRPHLIALDLMMPEMDGFDVLESIKSKEETRSIPVIVITAKELTEDDYNRLNHSVEALIQKGPMKREELLADLAAALKKLTRVPVG